MWLLTIALYFKFCTQIIIIFYFFFLKEAETDCVILSDMLKNTENSEFTTQNLNYILIS